MTRVGRNTWSHVILHHLSENLTTVDSTDHAWKYFEKFTYVCGTRESSHMLARSNHVMKLHATGLYETMLKEQQYDCSQKKSQKNFPGNYILSIHED
jgi:hypothetical protein